jgi:hypothetical protein
MPRPVRQRWGRCLMQIRASAVTIETGIRKVNQGGQKMKSKAVVSLRTGLKDPEKVTVAFFVAVGAAEQGRSTLMFLTKEAVRLTVQGVAVGTACEGCPGLA